MWSLTNVPPERQKLVGLTKGKLPGDEEAVVKLGLGAGATTGKLKEFMMIGTPEGEEAKAIGPSEVRLAAVSLHSCLDIHSYASRCARVERSSVLAARHVQVECVDGLWDRAEG